MPIGKNCITIWLSLLLIFLAGCDWGGDSSPAAVPPAATGSVSGTITTAAGSFIDSDVNDPNAPYAPNNDAAHAQHLHNPFIVGGFASFFTDRQDYFDVELIVGQVIILSISDHAVFDDNDLNLLLRDKDALPGDDARASSEGTSAVETIIVPENGTYDIVVEAVSGSSKYVLTVSAATSLAEPLSLAGEDDFVPGEIIIRFKNTVAGESSQSTLPATAKVLGLPFDSVSHDRPFRIDMKDASRRQTILDALSIKRNRQNAPAHTPADEKKLIKQDTLDAIRVLRGRLDIASADPNYIRKPASVPNDQYYPLQWTYPLINLPQAWDIAAPTSGITVAVVDTGIYMAHPDLIANLLDTGYDFISDPSRALDGDGIDNDPDDPGDSPTPGLSSFHGTHVAGTIAAMSNNSTGVAGVTWDDKTGSSKILPVRVLGLGGGTSYDVIQGVRYAAGLSNDSGTVPSKPVDIINLSFAGSGFSQAEQDTYTKVRNRGIICIAAAGNENTNVPGYPASYDNVISVSAVNMNLEKAWYSNYGAGIDVAAPGGDNRFDINGDGYADGILSTLVDDSSASRQPTYGFYNGTSMATPHVAGIAALMKGIYPALSPNDFEVLIKSGIISQDLGAVGRDNIFGYGLIDAFKALQETNLIASGSLLPAVLNVNPSALHFGPIITDLTLTISNGGDTPLQITAVIETAPWLQVVPDNVDGNGLGTYKTTVNRSGLPKEAYYATTISFISDNAGTIEVPVTIQVPSADVMDYNAGYHYILLIDPTTYDTLFELNATDSSGVYQFSFTNVDAGDYYVLAGTDSDDDGYICGPGEACGGYPTLEQLAPVTVNNENITGIDFTTGFNVNLSAAASTATRIPAVGFAIEPQRKSFRHAD